jgi:hypothetical protein
MYIYIYIFSTSSPTRRTLIFYVFFITLRQWANEGGKVVSPTHQPLLPPGNIPAKLLISVRGWVNPKATVQPEGLCQ